MRRTSCDACANAASSLSVHPWAPACSTRRSSWRSSGSSRTSVQCRCSPLRRAAGAWAAAGAASPSCVSCPRSVSRTYSGVAVPCCTRTRSRSASETSRETNALNVRCCPGGTRRPSCAASMRRGTICAGDASSRRRRRPVSRSCRLCSQTPLCSTESRGNASTWVSAAAGGSTVSPGVPSGASSVPWTASASSPASACRASTSVSWGSAASAAAPPAASC